MRSPPAPITTAGVADGGSSGEHTGSPWTSLPTRAGSSSSINPITSKPAARAYSATSSAKLPVPATWMSPEPLMPRGPAAVGTIAAVLEALPPTRAHVPHPLRPYEPLIINAALTGMVPTRAHVPAVPVTPRQIIDDAVACVDAGAAILHLHARRADESPAWERAAYEEF